MILSLILPYETKAAVHVIQINRNASKEIDLDYFFGGVYRVPALLKYMENEVDTVWKHMKKQDEFLKFALGKADTLSKVHYNARSFLHHISFQSNTKSSLVAAAES